MAMTKKKHLLVSAMPFLFHYIMLFMRIMDLTMEIAMDFAIQFVTVKWTLPLLPLQPQQVQACILLP